MELSAAANFDPSPPSPYSGKWREAAKADEEGTPRFTTYQAPDCKPIPFIQESFDFSGGQAVDTAEYPFHGFWSNEALNEKPQQLTIDGFIRGADYIAKRNALIQALRIKTDDNNPGYIDFPFWGRFPVVVVDYKIGEKSNEQGQCSVSITFTRAGVTLSERLAEMPDTAGLFDNAKTALKAAEVEEFEKKLSVTTDTTNTAMLVSAFIDLKSALLNIIGRIQAEKTRLSLLTNDIGGFVNLINQGIRAPKELAAAFFSSIEAITGTIKSIRETARGTYLADNAGRGGSRAVYAMPGENNEKNALDSFLAASDYTLNMEAVTVTALNTKQAAENLYRAAAFIAASELLIAVPGLSYQKAANYWELLRKLEKSIDRNTPGVHTAIEDMRIATSRGLAVLELSNEMKRMVNTPLPLLYLAHYLGCDSSRLRQLNSVADSFVIQGEVVYV